MCGFGGVGRGDGDQWCWCCKGGQEWVCFQMDELPELTQLVVQGLVLPEGR